MKRKHLYFIMAAEALLCAAVASVGLGAEGSASVLGFPFVQLGEGLRLMALKGPVGSGISMMLWIVLSLLPLLPVFLRKKDEAMGWEHTVCCILCPVMLVSLYALSHPVFLIRLLPPEMETLPMAAQGILNCTIWSFVVCAVVLRLLRFVRGGGKEKIIVCLRWLLCLLCLVYVWSIVSGGVSNVKYVLDGNLPGLDLFFVFLHWVTASLPEAFYIAIALAAEKLLGFMLAGPSSAETVAQAEKMSGICVLTLTVMVLSSIVMNLLQLLFMSRLYSTMYQASLPITGAVLVSAALLVARLIADNKRLSDDNDLFI